MFFYAKWGKDASRNYGTAMVGLCSNCQCERQWSLLVKRKVGVFMIFPFFYDHEYYLICNTCRTYFRIFGEQVIEAKKMNKVFKKYKKGKLTKEEMTSIVNSSKHLSDIEEPDTTWECPNCNFANPNITYRCRECGYKLTE